jgi:hypothetical protein
MARCLAEERESVEIAHGLNVTDMVVADDETWIKLFGQRHRPSSARATTSFGSSRGW